jgi:F-type H+-transporting ATPase subunit delta
MCTLKTARQYERNARRLFRFCLVKDTLDESRARAVTRKLLEKKPHGYFPVLKRFLYLIKEEYARHTAEIETAIPMPTDLRAGVIDRLSTAYGPSVRSSFVHNPDLIGGMRVKIGSDVYDGSVRSALDRLARKFGLLATNVIT